MNYNLKNPLVTIIIPVFNRPALLSRAVGSVIRQTYSNWECLIVDDKSSDSTFEVATGLAQEDHRINVLKNEKKIKNASVCRNIGLDNANGEFIIFFDSDDYLLENCLKSRIKFAEDNGEKNYYVFSNGYFLDRPGDLQKLRIINESNEFNFEQFLRGNYVWGIQNVLWLRQSILTIGGFDERFDRLQDVELHLKALSTFNNSFTVSKEVDSLINISGLRNDYKSEDFMMRVIRSYRNLFQFINSKSVNTSSIDYNISILKKFTIEMLEHDKLLLVTLKKEIRSVFISFRKVYKGYRYYFIPFSFNLFISTGNFIGKRTFFKFIIRQVI